VAGFDRFNGSGNGTSVVTINKGDVVTTNASETSTYTINADCTGSVVFTEGTHSFHFEVFLDPAGAVVSFIATDPGTVETFAATRVSE
jgi:hypothetical protein